MKLTENKKAYMARLSDDRGVISALAFVLISLLDTRVRTAEDLTDVFGYPVLGTIPTITADLENVEKTEEDDE